GSSCTAPRSSHHRPRGRPRLRLASFLCAERPPPSLPPPPTLVRSSAFTKVPIKVNSQKSALD
ncbi:unnamed protein product, partial [Musa hybrid cultivar]